MILTTSRWLLQGWVPQSRGHGWRSWPFHNYIEWLIFIHSLQYIGQRVFSWNSTQFYFTLGNLKKKSADFLMGFLSLSPLLLTGLWCDSNEHHATARSTYNFALVQTRARGTKEKETTFSGFFYGHDKFCSHELVAASASERHSFIFTLSNYGRDCRQNLVHVQTYHWWSHSAAANYCSSILHSYRLTQLPPEFSSKIYLR